MDIGSLVVGQPAANCYLVIDEATRAAVVIDPGDDPEMIAQAIRDADAEPKHILLTHGHPDHAFAAGRLQRSFPEAGVLMHEIELVQLQAELAIVEIFYDLDDYVEPQIGRLLKDRDTVEIGESKLRVLHTPGHTPGGLCFLWEDHEAVFTGDTLFAGGIGRTDLPGGSYDDLMRSIRDKLLVLPDDTVIYPGHGPESTIGEERRRNPWLVER